MKLPQITLSDGSVVAVTAGLLRDVAGVFKRASYTLTEPMRAKIVAAAYVAEDGAPDPLAALDGYARRAASDAERILAEARDVLADMRAAADLLRSKRAPALVPPAAAIFRRDAAALLDGMEAAGLLSDPAVLAKLDVAERRVRQAADSFAAALADNDGKTRARAERFLADVRGLSGSAR